MRRPHRYHPPARTLTLPAWQLAALRRGIANGDAWVACADGITCGHWHFTAHDARRCAAKKGYPRIGRLAKPPPLPPAGRPVPRAWTPSERWSTALLVFWLVVVLVYGTG